MSTLTYDNLPDVQRSVKARPLFAIRLSVRPLQVVTVAPVLGPLVSIFGVEATPPGRSSEISCE